MLTLYPNFTSNFGSLFKIQSQRDEILISAATVNDIEVIDVITANSLQDPGTVVNSTTVNLASESVSANGSILAVATVQHSFGAVVLSRSQVVVPSSSVVVVPWFQRRRI